MFSGAPHAVPVLLLVLLVSGVSLPRKQIESVLCNSVAAVWNLCRGRESVVCFCRPSKSRGEKKENCLFFRFFFLLFFLEPQSSWLKISKPLVSNFNCLIWNSKHSNPRKNELRCRISITVSGGTTVDGFQRKRWTGKIMWFQLVVVQCLQLHLSFGSDSPKNTLETKITDKNLTHRNGHWCVE